MAERMRKINPQAKVNAIVNFYNERLADEILPDSRKPDLVVDAIDSITSKCHLLARCRSRGIPVLTSMGTGGRMDPLQIRVADLARTHHDPLAKAVRAILRGQYEFPTEGDFGITAVYSAEEPIQPHELAY